MFEHFPVSLGQFKTGFELLSVCRFYPANSGFQMTKKYFGGVVAVGGRCSRFDQMGARALPGIAGPI